MTQTQSPSYLPADGYGYLAATRDADGGKRPISDTIYDSPEEAEAGARSIVEQQKKTVALFAAMVFGLVAACGGFVLIQTFAADRSGFLGGIIVIATIFSVFVYWALVLNRGRK